MKTLRIRGRKRIEYVIPIEVEDDLAKAADEGDEAAWKIIAKKVDASYDPINQWFDEEEFDVDDLEIIELDPA